MDFTLRNIMIGDINLIELYSDEGVKRKPMILMYHGYMCQKEFHIAHAYNLARLGFFVVLPDAYGHGERNTDGTICTFFEGALNTTAEINNLIDNYGKDERVDITRVGLSGFSMGGCITFNYLTGEDKRIKAAVPVIATPDWVSIMKTEEIGIQMKANGFIKTGDEMEEYIRIAAQVQPLNKFAAMKDIPLLILSGEKDPIIPVNDVKQFYEQLQPLYTSKEDIKHVVYNGVGHIDNLPMNLEMAQWFVKYLKP